MKKVFSNRQEVAEIFADQSQEEGRAGNVFFNGNIIYSYGYHFPIAIIISPDLAIFNANGYSSSTGQHKSIVKGALLSKGYRVLELPFPSRNYYSGELKDKQGPAKWLSEQKQEAGLKMSRARSEHMQSYWRSRVNELRKDQRLYADNANAIDAELARL